MRPAKKSASGRRSPPRASPGQVSVLCAPSKPPPRRGWRPPPPYAPKTPTEPASNSTNRQDRKSTRLNSSHVKISYAVFCLKKKKQAKRVIQREVTEVT